MIFLSQQIWILDNGVPWHFFIFHVKVFNPVINSWHGYWFDLSLLNDKLFGIRADPDVGSRHIVFNACNFVVDLAINTSFIFWIEYKVLHTWLVIELSQENWYLFVLTRQCVFPSWRETLGRFQKVDIDLIWLNTEVLRDYSRRPFSCQQANSDSVDEWLELNHREGFVQNEKCGTDRNFWKGWG